MRSSEPHTRQFTREAINHTLGSLPEMRGNEPHTRQLTREAINHTLGSLPEMRSNQPHTQQFTRDERQRTTYSVVSRDEKQRTKRLNRCSTSSHSALVEQSFKLKKLNPLSNILLLTYHIHLHCFNIGLHDVKSFRHKVRSIDN